MTSIPSSGPSPPVVRPRECACLTFSGERLLDGLLVLVQKRALVPPELEVVVPPLDRHELACDEDRYRILSKSVLSGRSPVPGGRQAVRYRPRSLISEHPCVGFARQLACFGYCLDAGQAHTHSVGITVSHVPGERILAAIRVLLREPETHVGRARESHRRRPRGGADREHATARNQDSDCLVRQMRRASKPRPK